MQDALVNIAILGAPHGVRGQLRLKSHAGDPAAFASYGPLREMNGPRAFKIASVRHLRDDLFVVSIEGVGDRDAAAALANLELGVPRAALPPPQEDEFYHADLIGLEVRDRAGAVLGRVAAVLNFGAGDILEVAAPGRATLLLPFTRSVVPVLDFAAGHVVAEPPAEVEARETSVGPAGASSSAMPKRPSRP